jgi:hypothetical protein
MGGTSASQAIHGRRAVRDQAISALTAAHIVARRAAAARVGAKRFKGADVIDHPLTEDV